MLKTNNSLNTIWKSYNDSRISGDKRKAKSTLNIFLKEILKEDDDFIEGFVESLCESVLENDIFPSKHDSTVRDYKIQTPLFNQLIVPVFNRKYKINDALYIRWIAQFEQFFYSNQNLTNQFLIAIDDELKTAIKFNDETQDYHDVKIRYFDAESFLKKSFYIDPNQITLRLLLMKKANKIRSALQEFPQLVLLDPHIFISELNNFEQFLMLFDEKENWESDFEYWNIIVNHWDQYNNQNNIESDSFESYLNNLNFNYKKGVE